MWVKERQVKQEVVLFIECTAQFQEQQAVTDSLQSLYEFQSVILGPDDFGLPATRKRKFTVGVLRTWGYLDTALSEIGKMFRIRRTGGDLYLAAPQSEIIDHLGARAVERGLPKHAANHMQSEELLPPAMAVRRGRVQVTAGCSRFHIGLLYVGAELGNLRTSLRDDASPTTKKCGVVLHRQVSEGTSTQGALSRDGCSGLRGADCPNWLQLPVSRHPQWLQCNIWGADQSFGRQFHRGASVWPLSDFCSGALVPTSPFVG